MGFLPEQDARRKLATRQKILEGAFKLFAEKTIAAVNMTEVAENVGVSFMTVYRHFDKKPDLVLAVNTWAWDQYKQKKPLEVDLTKMTGGQFYCLFIDKIIDLYRNEPNILRFNQYFNAYIKNEKIPAVKMVSFDDFIENLRNKFHAGYEIGMKDGTLRADIPENEMFSATLHLMLAAVTRYAVGLVYDGGIDPLQELFLLKKMLVREYVVEK